MPASPRRTSIWLLAASYRRNQLIDGVALVGPATQRTCRVVLMRRSVWDGFGHWRTSVSRGPRSTCRAKDISDSHRGTTSCLWGRLQSITRADSSADLGLTRARLEDLGLALLLLVRGTVSLNSVSVSVLLVDDQSSFLGVAADLLRSRGFEIVGTASNAADAISGAAQLRPDAVLLDVHLGADVEVLETLASLISLPNPPRVLLTSSDCGAVTSELARRHGAVGFVSKSDLAEADLAELFAT